MRTVLFLVRDKETATALQRKAAEQMGVDVSANQSLSDSPDGYMVTCQNVPEDQAQSLIDTLSLEFQILSTRIF